MQDNASIHRARTIKKWFEEHGIDVMEWSAILLDLNPIEHAWAKLKECMYKLNPKIEHFSSTKEELYKRFSELIKCVWIDLGQEYFNQLICTIDYCVNAVLEAKD